MHGQGRMRGTVTRCHSGDRVAHSERSATAHAAAAWLAARERSAFDAGALIRVEIADRHFPQRESLPGSTLPGRGDSPVRHTIVAELKCRGRPMCRPRGGHAGPPLYGQFCGQLLAAGGVEHAAPPTARDTRGTVRLQIAKGLLLQRQLPGRLACVNGGCRFDSGHRNLQTEIGKSIGRRR